MYNWRGTWYTGGMKSTGVLETPPREARPRPADETLEDVFHELDDGEVL